MIKNIIIGVFILLSAGLLINSCSKDKKNKELVLNLEGQLTQVKDSLGRIITIKDVQVVESQESIKQLRAQLFETSEAYNKKVKEVKALIAQKTVFIVKDKLIPYKDTTGFKNWSDSIMANCRDVIKYYEDSTVLIGTTARDSTAYYDVSLTILKNGIRVDSVTLIDSQYVSITEFKGGILRRNIEGKFKIFLKKKIKVEIKHTNPNFKNIGIDAYMFEDKKKNLFIPGIITGAAAYFILTKLIL